MPIYAYAILVAGWLLWLTPFFRARQAEKPAKQVDRRARWGILLVGISYCLLGRGRFWEPPPRPWPTALFLLFFAPPRPLSLTAPTAPRPQGRSHAGSRGHP